MKKSKWLVLVLMLYPTVAVAQTVPQIRRGAPLWFEHDDQSVLITEKYRLCEDEINDTRCHEFTEVTKIGNNGLGMSTFQFKVPNGVTNAIHIYSLQAFGDGEWSDPSPTLTLKITGKPLPPQNLRNTGSGVSSTTTYPPPSTPAPAAVMFPSSPTPTTTKPKP